MTTFSVDHLSFSYKNKLIFKDSSFSHQSGDVVGIMAPNGQGKTTLFGLMSGVLKPSAGAIHLDNRTYESHFSELKRKVVCMPSFDDLVLELSGYDHLCFYASAWHIPRDAVLKLIRQFRMEKFIKLACKHYSLGMKQRLCFALAVLTNADVLLLDEVSNGLDPDNLAYVKGLLKQQQVAGKIIYIISHQLDLLDDLCNHLLYIKDYTIHALPLSANDKDVCTIYAKNSGLVNTIKDSFHLSFLYSTQSILTFKTSQLSQDLFQFFYTHLAQIDHISFKPMNCQQFYKSIYHQE